MKGCNTENYYFAVNYYYAEIQNDAESNCYAVTGW